MTAVINGLSEIVDQYDLFLLDQFGVLHDGIRPYPSAIDTLQTLTDLQKKIVIVSNSGKRSAVNVKRMSKMGIEPCLYSQFVTSGDVAHSYLKSTLSDRSYKNCFLISRDQDTSAVSDLDLELTRDPASADIIIISGSEGDRYDESHYVSLLSEAAANSTLCLCTNPDKKMLTADGLRFGAGRIAEIYEEQGGDVTWIGKPHQSIYNYILKDTEASERKRALCVGDSIEHDIVGGESNQLHTLLVRTGLAAGQTLDHLTHQFAHYGATPKYLAESLKM